MPVFCSEDSTAHEVMQVDTTRPLCMHWKVQHLILEEPESLPLKTEGSVELEDL